jgi:hypothetical protein
MSGSSVDTNTLSKTPLSSTTPIECAKAGLEPNSIIFLPGMRRLPPRAGITAIEDPTFSFIAQFYSNIYKVANKCTSNFELI